MAQALQHDLAALISELPTTGTANISTGNAPSRSKRADAVVSVLLVKNIRQVVIEAVFLGDQIMIMSAHGDLRATIRNEVDRPRDVLSPNFISVQKEVLRHLIH